SGSLKSKSSPWTSDAFPIKTASRGILPLEVKPETFGGGTKSQPKHLNGLPRPRAAGNDDHVSTRDTEYLGQNLAHRLISPPPFRERGDSDFEPVAQEPRDPAAAGARNHFHPQRHAIGRRRQNTA